MDVCWECKGRYITWVLHRSEEAKQWQLFPVPGDR